MSLIGAGRVIYTTPSWAVGADHYYDWTVHYGTLLALLTSGDANHPWGTGFGTQLATGVAGFYKVNIVTLPTGGVNGRLVAFSDGTSTNREIVMDLGGVYGIASSGLTSSTDTVVVGVRTIVFAMQASYQKIEYIGGTPTLNTGLPWPTGMNMLGINTNGWESSSDMDAIPLKIALKYGAQNDTTFAAMRAAAITA